MLVDRQSTVSQLLLSCTVGRPHTTVALLELPSCISSSCRGAAHPWFGPCHQRFNTRSHHLIGKRGLVHFLANLCGSAVSNQSPKSNKAERSYLGVPPLLALQPLRLLEFRRGTTEWYDGLCLRHVGPSTDIFEQFSLIWSTAQ